MISKKSSYQIYLNIQTLGVKIFDYAYIDSNGVIPPPPPPTPTEIIELDEEVPALNWMQKIGQWNSLFYSLI